MSYFNASFHKAFLGTKATQAASPGVAAAVNNGFLITAGVHSNDLKNTAAPYALGVGTYGFFDPTTHLSVTAASTTVTDGKPLVLAAASLITQDKIGQFHGGYTESNKSKMINPRYVNKFYKVEQAPAENMVLHVGNTNATFANMFTFVNFTTTATVTNGTYTAVPVVGGSGTGGLATVVVAGGVITSVTLTAFTTPYANGDAVTLAVDSTPAAGVITGNADGTANFTLSSLCTFNFICGEDYTLRVRLHGAPVLAYLNRDSYRDLAAYTGCCADDTIAPTEVNSMIVFIQWATELMTSPYSKDFINVVLYDEIGNPWFFDADAAIAAGWPSTQLWSLYDTSIPHVTDALAGMTISGAYVGTTFSDCTFQLMDFEEKDIVQIEAQLVDETGDPCGFEGLCVTTECCGYKGEGYRHTILKEVILHESYLQNYVGCDLRIREVNLGTQIIDAVTPGTLYTRYCIQHVIPQMSNPSGTFNNHQYTLTIYIPTATAPTFETFMSTWLTAASNPVELETFGHVACTPTAVPAP